MDYTPLFSIKSPIATYFTSSKINTIENQYFIYYMVQIRFVTKPIMQVLLLGIPIYAA